MKLIILLFALLVSTLSVAAQENNIPDPAPTPDSRLVWGSVGLGGFGAYAYTGRGGVSFLLDFNMIKNAYQYKFVFSMQEEFNIMGPTPTETVLELGALIGKAHHNKRVHLALLGGVGAVYGLERGEVILTPGVFSDDYNTVRTFGIGVPIRAEVDYIFARSFGVGLNLYTNINTVRSFYGISGRLSFGKLR